MLLGDAVEPADFVVLDADEVSDLFWFFNSGADFDCLDLDLSLKYKKHFIFFFFFQISIQFSKFEAAAEMVSLLSQLIFKKFNQLTVSASEFQRERETKKRGNRREVKTQMEKEGIEENKYVKNNDPTPAD